MNTSFVVCEQDPCLTKLSYNHLMGTVGDRVLALRTEKGWTQAQLAERVTRHGYEISQSGIDKIEKRGSKRPRCLPELALAFGVRQEWLLTEKGSKADPSESRKFAAIDEELLGNIIKAIEEVAIEDSLTIAPANKGKHAAKLYVKAISITKPDLRDESTLKSFVQDELLNNSTLP